MFCVLFVCLFLFFFSFFFALVTQTLSAFVKKDATDFKLDRIPSHGDWVEQFTMQAHQTKNSSNDVMYFVYPRDGLSCAKSVTRQLSLADLHCFPRDFFYASDNYQPHYRKVILISRGGGLSIGIALDDYHTCCGRSMEEQFFANVSLPREYS